MSDTPPTGRRFGDADPEDGWDASDPVVLQIDNIARRLQELFGVRASYPSADRTARIDRLFEDLATIRDRVQRRDV